MLKFLNGRLKKNKKTETSLSIQKRENLRRMNFGTDSLPLRGVSSKIWIKLTSLQVGALVKIYFGIASVLIMAILSLRGREIKSCFKELERQ